MPFDGTFTPNSLEAAARLIGVTPIPMAELEAYKADQIKKHPASWWWDHRTLGREISMVSCFAMMFSGVCMMRGNALYSAISSVIFLISAVILVATSKFRAKGPAQWLEFVGIGSAIPEMPPVAIISLAYRVQEVVEDSHIMIGKLIQDTVTLDPYLLLCAGNERICLGIWDKTGIVQIAK